MEPSRDSLWPSVLALLRESMVFLILRLWRMGTSDMNSTPPATIASHWPAAMSPTPADHHTHTQTNSQYIKATTGIQVYYHCDRAHQCSLWLTPETMSHSTIHINSVIQASEFSWAGYRTCTNITYCSRACWSTSKATNCQSGNPVNFS